MDWLFLVALGVVWAAFLVPDHGKGTSPEGSVEEFGRKMELLAETERADRWVVTPRKGVRFIGTKARQRARIREKRKRILLFLIEATGVSFLIGLVPPLHAVWTLAFGFAGLTALYVWLLLRLRHLETVGRPGLPREDAQVAVGRRHPNGRYHRSGSRVRETYAGLPIFDRDDEYVHVIVQPAD
jgi:Flp pilus assembly protein TadB